MKFWGYLKKPEVKTIPYILAVPNPRAKDRYRSVRRLEPGRESWGSGVKFMFFSVFISFIVIFYH